MFFKHFDQLNVVSSNSNSAASKLGQKVDIDGNFEGATGTILVRILFNPFIKRFNF